MPSCSSSRRPIGSRDPAVLEAASRAHARRSARRDARVELRVPVARASASSRAWRPIRSCSRDVDRDIRAHFVTESRLFVDSVFRSERSVLELLTAEHTFVNEALARHYGLNDVRGTRFRRVELDDREPLRLARQGRRAARVVVPEPHVARVARPVAAREPARHAAGVAAAERRSARRDRRRAGGEHGARAARSAPHESVVQRVPRRHRSARLRARELRCRRPLARSWTARPARRSMRRACSSTARP